MLRCNTSLRLASLLTIGLLGAACAGSEPGTGVETPTLPTIDRLVVTLTPDLDTLLLGTSRVFTANVATGAGVARAAQIEWSAVDPTVASVAGGQVTAIGAGETQIIARAGTVSDTARLVVRAPSLELRVTPSAVAATLGDTIEFAAMLTGSGNSSVRTGTVAWTLSDSSTARIGSGGSLVTLTEGEVVLTANVAGSVATATVQIRRAPVYSVAILPSNVNLAVAGQTVLQLEPRDDKGRLLRASEVTWSSSKPLIAAVDRGGRVTGVAKGGAIITGTMEGKSASAAINVSSTPASSVRLTLVNDSLANGRTMQASATPLDVSGGAIVGRPVAWQSSNPAIATVNSAGLITAVAAGQTTISVICDGKIASQKVTVVLSVASSVVVIPGTALLTLAAKASLTAEVRDQFGTPLVGKVVTWSSQAATIASVNASGQVTGVALGTTNVKATYGSLSGSASVVVQAVPVSTVTLAPTSLSLYPGATSTIVPTARDLFGNVLLNRPPTWSSSATSVASVSASGVVTADAVGSATITVTMEGKTATMAVSVIPAAPLPVASVSVTFNSPLLAVGQSTQAVARTYDAGGNEVFGRTIVWSSGDQAIASVSASGLVAAVAAGSVAIEATSEGQVGISSITVSPPLPAPVSKVTLSAAATTLAIDDSTQVAVQLEDAAGLALTGRTITFASSNTAIATVSPTGLVVARSSGSATITATSEGKSATLVFTVSAPAPAPVATVSVVLNANPIATGQGTQAVVTLRDAAANVLVGRQIVFSSSNTAVATVSQAGLVSGLAAGSATISAVSEGKTGSAPVAVVVVPAVVVSVTVTLSPPTVTVGQNTTATATAKDSLGNVIANRPVSWSLASGSNVASLGASTTSTATVTGNAAGTTTVAATIGGVTGSAAVTVSTPAPPPPTSVTPPNAPQLLNISYPAVTGKQWILKAGDNLQTALNAAQRGDEIVLPAGATFTGTFTLQVKPGTAANGWITIRSDKLNQLPVGKRVTPADVGKMPKIITTTYQAALQTALSASGYWIAGVEITVDPALAKQQYGIVLLGDGSYKQYSLAVVASDLVLDRVYIHGAALTQTSRCIGLNSARTVIQDSYVHECHGAGFDAQAIGGWNGPGPYKIVNNTLAGSAENIMFGGADPAIRGLIPSDIEIRRNYIYTPASWKGVWMKKNLLETKNARRMLVEGNVLDGSWTDGQVGYALLLKSVNQSGACTWCATSDITVRYNVIRNAGAGFLLAGQEGLHPVGARLTRVLIEHNVVENISTGPYQGDSRLMLLIQNSSDLTIRNNTMTAPSALGAFLYLGSGPAATNMDYSNNIVSHGSYGLFATGFAVGEASLGNIKGVVGFKGNVIIATPRANYPSSTLVPTLAAAIATGAGVNMSQLNSATAGVEIP